MEFLNQLEDLVLAFAFNFQVPLPLQITGHYGKHELKLADSNNYGDAGDFFFHWIETLKFLC